MIAIKILAIEPLQLFIVELIKKPPYAKKFNRETPWEVKPIFSNILLRFCSQNTVHLTKGWDVFRDPPRKIDSGSMANQECLQITIKILKVIAYLVTFAIVLGGGVISKGTLLFMTSQLNHDRPLQYCNHDLGRDKQFIVLPSMLERVAWIWCLIIAFAIPEFGVLFRSARICFFKSWKKPPITYFAVVFFAETMHTVGTALLVFNILPNLDVVKGAMLTNCLCIFPAFLGKQLN